MAWAAGLGSRARRRSGREGPRDLANLAEALIRRGDRAAGKACLDQAILREDELARAGSHFAGWMSKFLQLFRADVQWDEGDREAALRVYAAMLADPLAPVEYARMEERCTASGADVKTLIRQRRKADLEFTALAGAEAVEVAPSAGRTLYASYWKGFEGAPGVLLLAMAGSSRHAWSPYVGEMTARGWHVLALDPPGQGMSVGPGLDRKALAEDGKAALEMLAARGAAAGRLGAVGASFGGAVALLTAVAGQPPVRALVLLSPAGTVDAARQRSDPTLLVTSVDDGPFTLRNREMFDEAPQGAWELRVLPETGHGTTLLEARPRLWAEVVDWLAEKL
ncbi:alpha/beta fold hydrolase [Carboxydochorda subterranea]|uniref:Alpha/beta fold hydrolase n=1 Tax=Carboxydichorda subterranea TaxID=3109565 RepID=A0ABZ1BXQ1_9FIRM|nr:alpha/beta fold hydrolase [Limnochorda sp. L945t]WRP17474.1 alpha/beta fold hydrolase [Limnochorda sp. L945t]